MKKLCGFTGKTQAMAVVRVCYEYLRAFLYCVICGVDALTCNEMRTRPKKHLTNLYLPYLLKLDSKFWNDNFRGN